jgi:hypothetical protein
VTAGLFLWGVNLMYLFSSPQKQRGARHLFEHLATESTETTKK